VRLSIRPISKDRIVASGQWVVVPSSSQWLVRSLRPSQSLPAPLTPLPPTWVSPLRRCHCITEPTKQDTRGDAGACLLVCPAAPHFTLCSYGKHDFVTHAGIGQPTLLGSFPAAARLHASTVGLRILYRVCLYLGTECLSILLSDARLQL